MHAKPKADETDRQCWGTRPEFVAGVEALSGVPVVLDVCAESWSAKAPAWLGPGSPIAEDALGGLSWHSIADRATAMQPRTRGHRGPVAGWGNFPFGSIDPWVARSLEEAAPSYLTWGLVPPRTDRPWWRPLVFSPRAHLTYVEAREQFLEPPEVKARRIAEAKAEGRKSRLSGASEPVVLWQIGGPGRLLPELLHRDEILEAGRLDRIEAWLKRERARTGGAE